MSFQSWLYRRESGLCLEGEQNSLLKRVYKTLAPFHQWNDVGETPGKFSDVGSVFNLEFSPEGNILVGACEKKTITLFDTITTKEFHRVTDAHRDYVNCVKFLDSRMFATCSDDTTVALWDLRQLKGKVRSLHGHSNWIKNIEYSRKNNLLVTSGFDGSIFTWDINSHTEQGLIYQKVFHTSGLMRCRLTPDGEKMVICTTGGYIMIVHNLDLTTLHKDLSGFRPGIYRLMQMGQQYIPQAARFDHVFTKQQKKNRVELVTDFPTDNDAEVILALEIHPKGHSFLSRNISHDELSEWSCIHDLNEEPEDNPEKIRRKRKLTRESEGESTEEPEIANPRDAVVFTINHRPYDRTNYNNRGTLLPPPPPQTSGSNNNSSTNARNNNIQTTNTPQRQHQRLMSHRQDNFVPDIWAAEVTVQERAIRQNRSRGSTTGYNFVYAISSGVLPAAAAAAAATTTATATTNTTTPTATATTTRSTATTANSTAMQSVRRYSTASSTSSVINNRRHPISLSPEASSTTTTDSNSSSTSSNDSPPRLTPLDRMHMRSLKILSRRNNHKIFQNPKKLLYYIQESNSGKGFIKEPCFSRDGRIVCSPYDNGVRLLGFNEDCSEFPPQYPHHNCTPKQLIEIQNISAHSDIVFSTKFSPRESLLVTGCRNGKVVWYYPKL